MNGPPYVEEIVTPLSFLIFLGEDADWRITSACRQSVDMLGLDVNMLKAGGERVSNFIFNFEQAMQQLISQDDGAIIQLQNLQGSSVSGTTMSVMAKLQVICVPNVASPLHIVRFRAVKPSEAKPTRSTRHSGSASPIGLHTPSPIAEGMQLQPIRSKRIPDVSLCPVMRANTTGSSADPRGPFELPAVPAGHPPLAPISTTEIDSVRFGETRAHGNPTPLSSRQASFNSMTNADTTRASAEDSRPDYTLSDGNHTDPQLPGQVDFIHVVASVEASNPLLTTAPPSIPPIRARNMNIAFAETSKTNEGNNTPTPNTADAKMRYSRGGSVDGGAHPPGPGSVHSKGSASSAGSSVSDLLRKGVQTRNAAMEGSLATLRRAILAIFAIIGAMNIASLIVTSTLLVK
jgi:hypothetical protein